MKETNWTVITGAPSSGKTYIVSELEKFGFNVVHDIARKVILDRCIKNDYFTQLEIVNKTHEIYENLNINQSVILEYGLPDNIVFQAINNLIIPESEKYIEEYKYKNVFILEPLFFEEDGIRNEYKDKQIYIYQEIIKIYLHFGYEPIIVPRLKKMERLDFIKKQLGIKNDTSKGCSAKGVGKA